MKIVRKGLLPLFLMIIIIVTVGCGDNNVADGEPEIDNGPIVDETPVEGGEVILPLTNFKTLNPLITDNSYYYQFSKLIFEGLFEFDENLNIVPRLAESYTISNEGRTISIRLRNDVYWHDGESLSSEDIGFTIDVIKQAMDTSIYSEVLMKDLRPLGSTNLNSMINYSIIDNRNIDIHFDDNYSNSLESLTFPIIPKHSFMDEGQARAYGKALEELNYNPIGTGPYKFVSYEKYKNVKLEANNNYWDGKPYINHVIGNVFEDEELILTAFETGQISFASTLGVDWDKYKQNERIKVLEYISPNYEFIGFNFNNPIFTGEEGKFIRQAINYAIDRQDIIERIFLGHGTQVDVPIHPASHLMTLEGYVYGYDMDKAKELLSNAGYKDRFEDGILRDEEGNTLSLRFTTNSFNPYRLRTAELIVENLRELGIDIITEFRDDYRDDMDNNEINEEWEIFNNKIQNGDFDMVLLGWELSTITNLFPMFHSSQIAGGNNFINYNNEELDQLMLNTSINNSEKIKKYNYNELQKHIVEELPYVSLFFRNRGLLIDTKVIGDLNPTFYNIYNGLQDCFIPESLQ